jgi:hypothetical protein
MDVAENWMLSAAPGNDQGAGPDVVPLTFSEMAQYSSGRDGNHKAAFLSRHIFATV